MEAANKSKDGDEEESERRALQEERRGAERKLRVLKTMIREKSGRDGEMGERGEDDARMEERDGQEKGVMMMRREEAAGPSSRGAAAGSGGAGERRPRPAMDAAIGGERELKRGRNFFSRALQGTLRKFAEEGSNRSSGGTRIPRREGTRMRGMEAERRNQTSETKTHGSAEDIHDAEAEYIIEKARSDAASAGLLRLEAQDAARAATHTLSAWCVSI